MSNLLKEAIALQSAKQSTRLKALSNKPIENSFVAVPSGFNDVTGVYIATTPDGGELQYKQGNFPNPPSLISVVTASDSGIGFGDWQ
jgi:hypothetical protein